jgi:hypothetical protein
MWCGCSSLQRSTSGAGGGDFLTREGGSAPRAARSPRSIFWKDEGDRREDWGPPRGGPFRFGRDVIATGDLAPRLRDWWRGDPDVAGHLAGAAAGVERGVLADIEARIVAPPRPFRRTAIPSRIATCPWPSRGVRGGLRPRSGQPTGAGGAVPRDLGPRHGDEAHPGRPRHVMPTEGVPPAGGARDRHRQPALARGGGRLHARADLARNIWYARDVDALAAHLGTAPILVIARELSVSDAPLTPLPVDTAAFRTIT